MKSWRKAAAAVLGIISVVIVCAYFLVKSVVLPETVKEMIIPRLEAIVQQTIACREITVGSAGIITLKDISIGDGRPREHGLLVKAREVLLHCRLLPLLSKKIIIEQITLREPYFSLVRNESGQFNFATSPEPRPYQSNPGAPDDAGAESQPALSLNIRSLAFQDGTLVFTDRYIRSPQPLETTVQDINGGFSDLSPVSPFDLNMTAEIASSAPSVLRLKAVIDPVRKTVTSDVKLTPFDLSGVLPYLPSLPFTMNKGCCSLDLTVGLNRALDVSSKGVLRLNGVDMATEDAADTGVSTALAQILKRDEINLDHDLSYRAGADTLSITKCAATIGGITLHLKGTIEACRTAPRCDITVDADQLSAAQLFNAVPPDRLPVIQNISTSGSLKAHLAVRGEMHKPEVLEVNGSLLADKLALQSDVPPRWKLKLDGGAELQNRDVVIKQLTAQTGNSSLAISGEIKNCFIGAPAARFRASAPSIDAEEVIGCVTELRKLTKSFEDDDEEDGRERRREDRAGFSNTTMNADVNVGRFTYRNLAVSDLQASSRLSGENFLLESLRGVMGDGAFSASGSIAREGEGLDCACRITGTRLQLAPILKAIAPQRTEEVSGVADLALTMQGRGATSDAFQKNLTGEGNFTVRNGRISGLKSLESVASFVKIDALKTLSFDESRGTFTIHDGAVHLNSSLKGKEVELYPVGTIGLDSAIDIALDMRLAPQISDQIADGVLTKYFKDPQGWTLLSLAIKSPPGGDVVVLPASSTIKNITEMLADILLKKEEAAGDERQDKKKALESLLQKLMQKSKEIGTGEAVQSPPQRKE
jgi:AsmA protein